MLMLMPDPLVGQNVGGYIVEQPLGEGGMGLVYRARHPILNRHFAIKVLRPEVAGDANISSSFTREAQTLSCLKHPHIIDIVGFGPLDDGRQYMVMEFVEGRTLESELAIQGPMLPVRALHLADAILDALSAAHSVDVIHRDLKPSNVFLARVSGGAELLKLLDFGLAKQQPQAIAGIAQEEAAAGASVIAGTPEYMAPEQALGQPASKQSDLYSFGVMLYEMLTGALPFVPREGAPDRIDALLAMHLEQAAPSLAQSAGGSPMPAELEEIVADLLEKKPADRPQSADTVRSRLLKVHRGLQQEATRVGANPLLGPRPSLPLPAEKSQTQRVAPLVAPTRSLIQPAPNRPRLGGWALAAAALLLAAAGWWSQRASAPSAVEPSTRVTASTSAVAAPAMVVPPGPVAIGDPPPAPSPAARPAPRVEDPATLTPPPMPAPEPRAAAAAAPMAIGRSYHLEIHKSGCVPSERWRSSARSSLEEIQQSAASLNDRKAWESFERAEPGLSAAITGAVSGVDCDAVEQQIQQLAVRFKHR